MSSSKKLMRSRDDKMIVGVAAGLAHYLGIDPTLVRLAWVDAILLPGPNVIIIALYVLLAFIMPLDSMES
jgi:phage shock protein C